MNRAPTEEFSSSGASRPYLTALWLFLLGTALAFPLLLALATNDSVSHDEQQHVAAGILAAREGLEPYGDYPYFHLPYLISVYRLLFAFTDYDLLAARFFSAACAAATIGVVFALPWLTFSEAMKSRRVMIGALAAVLLLCSPVFFRTAGHAWNQEPSTLLALLAFLCCHRARANPHGNWFAFGGGVLLAAAIGLRVTLAPCALPFGIWVGWRPISWRERWRSWVAFGGGLLLGLGPAFYAWWQHPAGFAFGNIEFPKVNIIYRMATGEPRTMTLAKKLRFAVKSVLVPNWALMSAVGLSLAAVLAGRSKLRVAGRLPAFLLLSLPFLLAGALAPSPQFTQYYYPLAPFVAIGGILLAGQISSGVMRGGHGAVSIGLAVIAAHAAAPAFRGIREIAHTAKWVPVAWHRYAAEMAEASHGGRILTLAPALVLEGKARIYPELSTGPFAWRISPFVRGERRPSLRLLAPDDLEARLAADPPAAILLRCDPRWEQPLQDYAQRHGFSPAASFGDRQLWLAHPPL